MPFAPTHPQKSFRSQAIAQICEHLRHLRIKRKSHSPTSGIGVDLSFSALNFDFFLHGGTYADVSSVEKQTDDNQNAGSGDRCHQPKGKFSVSRHGFVPLSSKMN